MSTTAPKLASPIKKLNNPVPGWLVRTKGKWVSWGLIGIVIAYVGILILAPLVSLALGAFSQGPGAIFEAFQQSFVLTSFWNTLWISLVVVVIHAIFGTIVSWVFVRHRFPGRGLINGLIDMPFAVSPVVAGYMLLLLFGRNGLFGPLVEATGMRVAFAFPGMVLATLFVTMPFMIRELVPVLEAFDTRQEKAAATLGASNWQTFWRVTFPALRWGLIYGVTLTFARALGEFGAVLVIGGAAQGSLMTTTLFIYHSLEERQYIAAYSAALALGLFSLVLVVGSDWLRSRKHS
jgi:sulfate/thiosulfate transport system permease protein